MAELNPVSGDPDAYEVYHLPLETVGWHAPRSRLYRDYEDSVAIVYRPLQKVNENEWLIDVNSRVYVADEEMLEDGLEAADNG